MNRRPPSGDYRRFGSVGAVSRDQRSIGKDAPAGSYYYFVLGGKTQLDQPLEWKQREERNLKG